MTLITLAEISDSNQTAAPDFSRVYGAATPSTTHRTTPATSPTTARPLYVSRTTPASSAPPVVLEIPAGLTAEARRRGLLKEYSLWLLLRAWNDAQDGRPGIVEDTPELRQWLTRFMGVSTLYGRLRTGEIAFWRRIKLRNGQRAILLTGGGKLAERWELGPIMRRMVTVPVEDFTGGLARQRAALYAAEIAPKTRNGQRVISRDALERHTGVKPRTQRRYDRAAGTKRHPNWSTTPRPVERNGQDYYTRQLGNSYDTRLMLRSWGKAKQHNATRTTSPNVQHDGAVHADKPKVRYSYKLPRRSPTADAPVRVLVNRRRRIWHELPELQIPGFVRPKADRLEQSLWKLGKWNRNPQESRYLPPKKRVVTGRSRQRGLFARDPERLDRRGCLPQRVKQTPPVEGVAELPPASREGWRRLRDATWAAMSKPDPVEVVEVAPMPTDSTVTGDTPPPPITVDALAVAVHLEVERACWYCAKRHTSGHLADAADGMTWWTCTSCADRADVVVMLERLLS